MRVITIILINYLYCPLVLAKDKKGDLDKIKEEIISTIPKIKKITSHFVLEEENDKITHTNICVQCDDILKLTNDVNKIIYAFPNVMESNELLLENGNLEALSVYTSYSNRGQGENSCTKNEELTNEFSNFNQEELNLIFTQDMASELKSFQIKNEDQKTIWLRGKNRDQDKFIKVVINKDGTKNVSFYTLKEKAKKSIAVYKPEYNLPNLNTLYRERNISQIASGETSSVITLSDTDFEKYSYNAKIGANITYEYFMPQKITYLDISGNYSISDSVQIKGRLESSTEKNEAQLQVGTKDEKTSSSVNVDLEGNFSVRGKHSFNISDNIDISNSVSYISDGVIEFTTKAKTQNSSILVATYKINKNGGQSYGLGSEYKFTPISSVSFKFENKKEEMGLIEESNYWLTYTQKF